MKNYIKIPKESWKRRGRRYFSGKVLKLFSKYNLGFQIEAVESIKSYARYARKDKWNNAVPPETDLRLDTISLPIIITYAEWLRVHSRLPKLFSEFPQKEGFPRNSLREVYERIQKITESSVQVRSSSPIGYIQIPESDDLFRLTKIVKIDVVSFFKGHIGIVFTCSVGSSLHAEIEELLRTHFYSDVYLYAPPLKRIFRTWGMQAGNGTIHKQKVLKEKINTVKNELLGFFKGYLGLGVAQSRALIPSLDIWHFDCGTLMKPYQQEFWSVLDHTPRKFSYYRSEKGKYSLTLPDLSEFDASVKIVANLDRIKPGTGERKSVHEARSNLEFFNTDFSLLWFYYFHNYQLVETIGSEMHHAAEKSSFWSLKNFKLRDYLLEIEFRLDTLAKDFDLDFQYREIGSDFLNCESLRRRKKVRLDDEIKNGILFQKEKLERSVQSLRKFLDNAVETRIANINILTQILVLILGLVTVYDQSEKTREAILSIWESVTFWFIILF
ncbi:hypothetical protein AZI87_08060 [Bdellovibrio bacteriovorus]|uniref:Uncharacterized protein n=1 Tax=Bdellovibrio bacteriovorus TaxID=959 RepID=A0A162GXI3_BDEBC|nr:hypothetical protein [Bdellovibrio bacteriovorus]KYG69159.1 hypothetical protein AZI87_08060 [Bdellovibrio bacteriovorus]